MENARKLWMLLFVGANTLSSPARAQDLWEISEGAETWEPLWDEGALLSPGSWNLSILGGRREGWLSTVDAGDRSRDQEQRVETYAIATLSLPLDKLWGGESRGSESGEVPEEPRPIVEEYLALNDPSPKEVHDLEGDQAATPTVPSAPPARNAPPSQRESKSGLAAVRSSRLSQSTEDERSLLAVISELSHRVELGSGLRSSQLRLKELGRRARLSGLAPELRLRGVYGFDQTTSQEDTDSIIPGETTTRGGRDSLAEVRLTFHLEHLLFSSQDVAIERQKTQAEAESRKMVAQAVSLFFEWKAADGRARDTSLFDEERTVSQVHAQTALAHLHLMTKGWFRGWVTLRKFGLTPAPSDPTPKSPQDIEASPR
jgi:hypothetical protein